MDFLLQEIRSCKVCANFLPLGPRPILEVAPNSKILLVGQAPGRVVHESGTAWSDQSGKKLREWLGVDEETFYNTANFGIVPMAFCYPGKGKTGDLPPRKECAPLWHQPVLDKLENLQLVLLIGSYATHYYLPDDPRNLTDKVGDFESFLPTYWPIPHPSPVNRFWRSKNPWFEESVVSKLQLKVQEILK